jgi:hypothetical protein
MTAITHHSTGPSTGLVRRPTLHDRVRRSVAAVATPARWLKAEVARIGAAGQLGPKDETEKGRRTGARI